MATKKPGEGPVSSDPIPAPDTPVTDLAHSVELAGQAIQTGLQDLASSANTLGDFYQVPLFELVWKPFVWPAPLADVVAITVRAPTAEMLATQFALAREALGPVLRQQYESCKALVPANGKPGGHPAHAAPPPAESDPVPDAGDTGRRRRRGSPKNDDAGKESGSFPIKTIQVQRSRKDTSRLMLIVEGHKRDERVIDMLPAGPPAWAKYFPKDEQDDWKADMESPGTIYDAKEDPPMICEWVKAGEYTNIARIVYED